MEKYCYIYTFQFKAQETDPGSLSDLPPIRQLVHRGVNNKIQVFFFFSLN